MQYFSDCNDVDKMRNIAKCKLCQSVIESISETDYVNCLCGEIAVEGIDMKCHAVDFANFLRVDDQGNEIIPEIRDKNKPVLHTPEKPSRDDLINMLDEMVKNIESLPSNAMITPINQYDHAALIMLLHSIFKAEK